MTDGRTDYERPSECAWGKSIITLKYVCKFKDDPFGTTRIEHFENMIIVRLNFIFSSTPGAILNGGWEWLWKHILSSIISSCLLFL